MKIGILACAFLAMTALVGCGEEETKDDRGEGHAYSSEANPVNEPVPATICAKPHEEKKGSGNILKGILNNPQLMGHLFSILESVLGKDNDSLNGLLAVLKGGDLEQIKELFKADQGLAQQVSDILAEIAADAAANGMALHDGCHDSDSGNIAEGQETAAQDQVEKAADDD